MADPFEAENDDEWSQWFAALRDDQKAKVIKAVTGESNEFSLQNSNITHLPHRFLYQSRGLTSLDLCDCSSLALLCLASFSFRQTGQASSPLSGLEGVEVPPGAPSAAVAMVTPRG